MNKQTKENKIGQQAVILSLIERFDYLEELTGKDFKYARRIILRWSKEKGIFDE